MNSSTVLILLMLAVLVILLVALYVVGRDIRDELRSNRIVMKGATTVNESIAQDTQRAAGRIETAASKIEKSTGYPGSGPETPGTP